jgi:hypothetical protein
VSIELASGVTVLYRLEPARDDFRALPDWREVGVMRPTVDRVVRRLRERTPRDQHRAPS